MSEASKGTILIVDDEPMKRVTLGVELTQAGYHVSESSDTHQAMKHLASHPVNVVITELRLPETDGLNLLQQIKGMYPETHVMIMTAFGSIDTAVEAMKLGAYDYLAKPIQAQVLLEKLNKLRFQWQSPVDGPEGSDGALGGVCAGVGVAARQLSERVRTALGSEQPVLLVGPTGTGKVNLAELLHRKGRRPNGPLVKCSCVASSPEALEAALFGAPSRPESNGHPPVAQASPSTSGAGGHVVSANGGTLYLADVDQLPPSTQARLLRVLEDGCIAHAQGGEPVRLQVRFIFGTTRNLHALCREGKFREDLYYRMASVSIALPALRDRREDLPALAEQALRALTERDGRVAKRLHPHTLELLSRHEWPGNLRELEHVLNQAAGRAASEQILPQDIALTSAPGTGGEWHMGDGVSSNGGLTEAIAGVERTLINGALKRAAGNQAKAAKFLGIPRTTLRDKMAKYGLVGDGVRREG